MPVRTYLAVLSLVVIAALLGVGGYLGVSAWQHHSSPSCRTANPFLRC